MALEASYGIRSGLVRPRLGRTFDDERRSGSSAPTRARRSADRRPAASNVTEATPPRCPTRTRLYRGGKGVAEGLPAEENSGHPGPAGDPGGWPRPFYP